MVQDLRRHLRFLLSFALGLAIGLTVRDRGAVDRLLVFSMTFSLCYLVLTGFIMRGLTSEVIRRHADQDDEGMLLIAPLAMGSVAINLWAILQVTLDPEAGTTRLVLALISVPLSWAMIHTVMAFHYAHLWYARGADGRESRCLSFPGVQPGGDAQIWDFLYYSFVLGMTAQTADISTLTTRVRRITLAHSVFSFFHNTVLLALLVSAMASLGSPAGQ